LPHPGKSTFKRWYKNHSDLHTIKTKPIAQARLDSHTEEDVEAWFKEYREWVKKLKILEGKYILNMDETGVRIGCPYGEDVVVPKAITEHYSLSPENRKSLTIIETIKADGSKPLPPFIIAPGAQIMENWLAEELEGDERIGVSSTGYTDNNLALQYLDHMIKYSGAGPDAHWRISLLDGHESHQTDDFQIKAQENKILPCYFPSHLTHVLQPLDVGIFQPWKHFHSKAVQRALRSLDYEYNITSFFRDLPGIRRDAFKHFAITNAFENSGMYPINCTIAIEKMRKYKKRIANEEPDLPQLERPIKLQALVRDIEEFSTRDPTQFSSPSRHKHYKMLKTAKVHLNKGVLAAWQVDSLYAKEKERDRRGKRSRRSLQKGGPSTSVQDLREKQAIKDNKENIKLLRRAQTALRVAVNKAKADIKAQGIQVQKDEKARLARVQEWHLRGLFLPPEDLVEIRAPDKNPTPEDILYQTEEGHEALL
jgi:hypothetical protein